VISGVVPVFNEERSVALLYEELQAALDPLEEQWEALYVDDGSTDGTFGALTRLHARNNNVRVIRLRR
jgi:glycosyltransferase involved in cell wall biosynthesis